MISIEELQSFFDPVILPETVHVEQDIKIIHRVEGPYTGSNELIEFAGNAIIPPKYFSLSVMNAWLNINLMSSNSD